MEADAAIQAKKVKKSISKAPSIRKEKKMEQNLKIPTYNEYEIMKEGNNKYNLLQIKEICRFYKQKLTGKKEQLAENLYNYLHKDEIKSNIIINNPFKERYTKNNDLFIHIRLTDVACFNPGIKYYINAIKNIILII